MNTEGSATRLSYGLNVNPMPPLCGQHVTLTLGVSNQTDTIIHVSRIDFQIVVGPLATALTNDTSDLHLNHPEDWKITQKGGAFHIAPLSAAAGAIGADGLEFDIGNIHVNDESGPTPVTVTEHSAAPDTARLGTWTTQLTKETPPLALNNLVADPPDVDYLGDTTLTWSATHGAVIEIVLPDKTIRTVKDMPGRPLAAQGSYLLEGLEKSTVITVIATGQKADGTHDRQEKQITVALCPATLVHAEALTQATPGGQPATQFRVKPQSVQRMVISGPDLDPLEIEVDPTALDENGCLTVPDTPIPRLFPTTYKVEVENPDSAQPTDYAVDFCPPTDTWIRVGPSPNTDVSALTATTKRLCSVEMCTDDASQARVSSSTDGMTWTTHKAPAPWASATAGFEGVGAFTTDTLPQTSAFAFQDRVFLCSTLFDPNFTFGMWYSDDLETWVQAPPLDLPQQQDIAVAGCMGVDPKGHVWAACHSVNDADSTTFRLFKTEDLKTWTETTALKDATIDANVVGQSLNWINGKMWFTASKFTGNTPPATIVMTEDSDGVITQVDGLELAGKPGAQLVAIGDDAATVLNTVFMDGDTARDDYFGYPLVLTRIQPDNTVRRDPPKDDLPLIVPPITVRTIQIAQFNGVIFVDTVGQMNGLADDPEPATPGPGGIWMYCPSIESAKQ
ncbi:hypothetical protein [Tateyamaria sp. SN3-11]|uniref:hypothetical protein n=1 Tax=Tateyamaria sp. SN3-11 TaxID=3092147 RepID=UPI0039ECCDCB